MNTIIIKVQRVLASCLSLHCWLSGKAGSEQGPAGWPACFTFIPVLHGPSPHLYHPPSFPPHNSDRGCSLSIHISKRNGKNLRSAIFFKEIVIFGFAYLLTGPPIFMESPICGNGQGSTPKSFFEKCSWICWFFLLGLLLLPTLGDCEKLDADASLFFKITFFFFLFFTSLLRKLYKLVVKIWRRQTSKKWKRICNNTPLERMIINTVVSTPSRLFSVHLCAVCSQLLSCVWLFATPWTEAPRLLCPWDFPGKNTGVGCHFLLHLQIYISL